MCECQLRLSQDLMVIRSLVVAVKAPEDVHYNPNEHILSFTSASDYYCVRVLVSHDVGSSWQMYEPCAPSTGGSMKLTSPRLVRQVNVSLCLERRQDVCSTSVLATIGQFTTFKLETGHSSL